jgi:pyridoxal phosphate enzyme (YggS family)
MSQRPGSLAEIRDTHAVAERVARIRELAAAAARRAGRAPDAVEIVAVSKTVERGLVDAAYAAGIRHFGENRVQEAATKFAVPLPNGATLHLVGQLQTNKAKPAAQLFGLVESVDRPALVEALDKAAALVGRRLPVLIQVNVAGERQKAGCMPADAADLVAMVAATGRLEPIGLMTIAPLVDEPEAVRPVFRALRHLRDELADRRSGHDFWMLSMGMTNDFAVAIEEGATHVRIGRAIFGERP